MSRAAERGGIVGDVICVILVLLGTAGTIFFTQAARSTYRANGDAVVFGAILIPLLFTIAFLSVLLLSRAQRRKEAALAERRALNPDMPWLWSDEWREGRIRSVSAGASAALIGGFATVWNTVVVGVGVAMYYRDDLWRAPQVWVFEVLFGIVGLLLIAGTVYVILSARKSPPVVLEMDPVPGVLGGELRGVVRLPDHVPVGSTAQVSLECERRASGHSRSSSTTLWKDEVSQSTPGGGLLPISFRVPFDLPPSELPERVGTIGGSLISWFLGIRVSLPGADYHALFSVPVFATATSDAAVSAGQVDAGDSLQCPPDAVSQLVESSPSRTELALPAAKGLGCGVSSLILLPLLTWPVARYGFGADGVTALTAVAIAFAVGAGVLGLASLGVWITVTGIAVDAAGIHLTRGRWPIGNSRVIPLAEVEDVTYSVSETASVTVNTRDGTRHLVVSGYVKRADEAKWIAAELTRAVARYR